MGNSRVEITVGLFLVMGFLALGWLALQLGEVPWLTEAKTYTLNAEFSNISGVKSGADIQISGVTVGKVRQLRLSEDNLAIVTMQLDKIGHQMLHIVQGIGTLRVTRHLRHLPRIQLGKNGACELG